MNLIDADRQRLHTLVDEFVDTIVDAWEDEDEMPVLEDATVVGMFAVPDDSAVSDGCLMKCTSSRRYIQEGILRSAQREHDIAMLQGRLEDDDE